MQFNAGNSVAPPAPGSPSSPSPSASLFPLRILPSSVVNALFVLHSYTFSQDGVRPARLPNAQQRACGSDWQEECFQTEIGVYSTLHKCIYSTYLVLSLLFVCLIFLFDLKSISVFNLLHVACNRYLSNVTTDVISLMPRTFISNICSL